MKTNNVILDKSYQFSIRIVKAYKFLTETHKEFVLSKQLLKSGTSIGANAEEGAAASTKKDFINKLSISLKEARETNYWLRLLRDTDYFEKELSESLINDCTELIKILVSIINTTKSNQ